MLSSPASENASFFVCNGLRVPPKSSVGSRVHPIAFCPYLLCGCFCVSGRFFQLQMKIIPHCGRARRFFVEYLLPSSSILRIYIFVYLRFCSWKNTAHPQSVAGVNRSHVLKRLALLSTHFINGAPSVRLTTLTTTPSASPLFPIYSSKEHISVTSARPPAPRPSPLCPPVPAQGWQGAPVRD